ncbi:dihydrofolate reductase family protein [Nocardioides mesophilus]|uniref:Dihydrofolate reductase n=1 Tax=Nocardioides mesophilus TaxID=433659 RepID=A0A7G9RCF7_9ACTN|nr:dihydrofolate reductase family protein [Nocardioides mesophilus]QNN53282.1 dihydrofolate reductase [Nocardioides mesophilus]
MPLTQYFVASSLDGFIAASDHDLDWLLQFDEADGANPYDAFMRDVGVLAMGASTYEWVQRHDPHGFASYGDRPIYVFTHRELTPAEGVRLVFTHDDVPAVHAAMAADAGDRNIWLVGGGELVGEFLDHDLLDELWLGLTPVVLGAGAPLLPRRRTTPMRLVSSAPSANGTFVHLRYSLR